MPIEALMPKNHNYSCHLVLSTVHLSSGNVAGGLLCQFPLLSLCPLASQGVNQGQRHLHPNSECCFIIIYTENGIVQELWPVFCMYFNFLSLRVSQECIFPLLLHYYLKMIMITVLYTHMIITA